MTATDFTSTSNSGRHGKVIVVHGIGGKRLWMLPLCYFLRRHGMEVVNWSYPSFSRSIASHGKALSDFLELNASSDFPVNIVAHSMGSIVVRSALQNVAASFVQRIVMLAPPNRGAPLATWASSLVGRFCQPIRDLSTVPRSYVNALPRQLHHEVAVLAAKYDCLVPRSRMRLDGAEHYLELHATHNSLLLSPYVARLTLAFLQNGQWPTMPIFEL